MSALSYCTRVEFSSGSYLVVPGRVEDLRHVIETDSAWVRVALDVDQTARFKPSSVIALWELKPVKEK